MAFLILGCTIGLTWGAVPQSTIRTDDAGITTYVAHEMNATLGLTLNGDRRTAWPAAASGGGGLVAPTFIVEKLANSTIRSTNGTDGSTYSQNAVWDLVMNATTIACQTSGGKIVVKEGNYTKELNLPVIVYSNTEIELQNGAVIWIHGDKQDGVEVFRANDAEKIVIHGNGMIDGNKNQQTVGYQTAVEFNACTQCTVDTYIQHMKGYNVVDNFEDDDVPVKYVNRFYPDAMEKITPSKNKMFAQSQSTQIWNASSTFTAATVTATYGDISYVTDDVINRPEALLCEPNLGDSATEPVRLNIVYAAGQVWNDTNVGIWMKFDGTVDSTFDVILEIGDKVDSQYLQCNLPNIGTELNDEGMGKWIHFMFVPNANTTDTIPRINMSDIDDIRIRFMSAVDTWNVTVDDMRLFPIYTETNGRFGYCTDGPYDNQFNWLLPLADEFGFKICFATSYDIPGESPGNAAAYLANLTKAYQNGHLIGVYTRAFDEQAIPEPLSDAEVLDFALLQKQYLIDNGLVEDFFFVQMNRHILDTHVRDLLDDYFHVIKGTYHDSLNIFNLPFLDVDVQTTTPAAALARVKRAHSSKMIAWIFNHLNAEPDTYAELKTMFQWARDHDMESVTWRDVYVDQCVTGNR